MRAMGEKLKLRAVVGDTRQSERMRSLLSPLRLELDPE